MSRPLISFAATLATCMSAAPAIAAGETSIGGTAGVDALAYDPDTSITGGVAADMISGDADIDVTLSQELDNGIQAPVNVGVGRVAPLARPSRAAPAMPSYTFDLGTK